MLLKDLLSYLYILILVLQCVCYW